MSGTNPTEASPDAVLREWSDLAYELYALACNSTTDGHSTTEEWTTAFHRLRDRFHKALAELPPRVQDRHGRPDVTPACGGGARVQ